MSDSPLILPSSMKNEPKKAETVGTPVEAPADSAPEAPEKGAAAKVEPKEKKVEPNWLDPKVHFPIDLFEDRIAIKRADAENMSEGGIIIPGRAQEKTMTGMVVGAGAGITKGDGSKVPMQIEVGDIAVFEKHRAMVEVTVNGFKYHICRASDLIGKSRSSDVKIKSDGGAH